MDWTGKSRAEIEAELLARLDACKASYANLKASQAKLAALVRDIEAGSRDGLLAARQANDGARALIAAASKYQAALRDFTYFIIDGRLPPDD